MSIDRLTDSALGLVPVRRADAALMRATGSSGGSPPKEPSDVLHALTKYFPTESMTLYVATLSVAALLNTLMKVTAVGIYWFYVLLTPALWAAIYIGKRKKLGLPPVPAASEWPYWKIAAATIAFAAWALAVPNSPYLTGSFSPLAGFFATFASVLLSLLDNIFERAPERAG